MLLLCGIGLWAVGLFGRSGRHNQHTPESAGIFACGNARVRPEKPQQCFSAVVARVYPILGTSAEESDVPANSGGKPQISGISPTQSNAPESEMIAKQSPGQL